MTGRPAKQRSATYVKVDADIAAAKLRYGMNTGYIFALMNPNYADNAWMQFQIETLRYLDHVAYLIGLK